MYNYEEGAFSISIVAKKLSIHPQTLRQYEKEGLLAPSRTDGKMRLYSQKDIDKLQVILRLTRDLGVNLAGVDIILRLKDKLVELDALVEELQATIDKQNNKQNSVSVKRNSYDLIIFKQ